MKLKQQPTFSHVPAVQTRVQLFFSAAQILQALAIWPMNHVSLLDHFCGWVFKNKLLKRMREVRDRWFSYAVLRKKIQHNSIALQIHEPPFCVLNQLYRNQPNPTQLWKEWPSWNTRAKPRMCSQELQLFYHAWNMFSKSFLAGYVFFFFLNKVIKLRSCPRVFTVPDLWLTENVQ